MDKQREAFVAWYSNWASSKWEPSFGEVWDAACEWQAALSHAEGSQHLVDASVTFVDGLGASRNKPSDCREGLKYITAGPITYWPLSTDDEQRLRRAECGDGEFHGPTVSHAEGETPFAWHRGGRAHEMLFADDLDGAPTDLSDGWEPLFKRPAPQVAVPEGFEIMRSPHEGDRDIRVSWQEGDELMAAWLDPQGKDSDELIGRLLWKLADALLAAAPTAPAGKPKSPRCRGTGQHVVGPIDCPRISVCELCKAPQVAVPEGWTDRHTRVTRFALWRLINEGYHRANAAAQKGQPGTADDVAALLDDVERAEEARGMLAVPTAPAPTKGEEIHVNVDGDSVYTLPLEPTGMAAPRFVVHVPAPDEREIAALREDAERWRLLRKHCGRGGKLTIAEVGGWELKPFGGDDPDGAIDRLRAGKEGKSHG